MRIHSAAVFLWLLTFPSAANALATQYVRPPAAPLTSRQMTDAILERFRKGETPPPPAKAAAPSAPALPVEPEKVTLPTMHVTTRRGLTESDVAIPAPPPKPVLGTGVREYRNGKVKVRSIFFIPVCISIDW